MEEIKRDTSLNIYQRMAAITAALQTVAKNLTVDTGRGKGYKAVSERDIIDNVKPIETRYGVYSYPASRKIIESATLESENTYNGNTTKKTTFFERIETVYRFINIDKPEEYVETTTFAEGIDSQDKGSGKAMTYGDKYALMKMYKISTGDDPDATASEEEYYKPRSERKPPVEQPAKPKEDVIYNCEVCGKPLQIYLDANGKPISMKKWAEGTKSKFGKCMCADCVEALG